MTSRFFILILAVVSFSCKRNTTPKTIVPPKVSLLKETVNMIHCESAIYDPLSKRIYASLIGYGSANDGAIAMLDSDGTVINPKFIDSLDDPKGLAISNNKLYIADIKSLKEVDLNTGKLRNTYRTAYTYYLNDVAADAKGNIYVSDTNASRIYQLDSNGNFTVWLEDAILNSPNGILIQDNTMYVATWGDNTNGRLLTVDMMTQTIDTLTQPLGNLDGIAAYDKDNVLVSDWSSGTVHMVNKTGVTVPLLQDNKSVGDIFYITSKNTLLLPNNIQNSLKLYKLE